MCRNFRQASPMVGPYTMGRKRAVRNDGSVRKRFVVIEQVYQVDGALEIGVLLSDLEQQPPQLELLSLGYVGHKTNQPLSSCFSASAKTVDFRSRMDLEAFRVHALPSSSCQLLPLVSLVEGWELLVSTGNVRVHHL